MRLRHAPLLAFFLVQACATSGTGAPMPLVVSEQAQRIYRDAILIDMHNDMPSKMLDEHYDADVRHGPGSGAGQGETDVPRLVESGLTAVFLSAWVDAPYAARTPDGSWARVQLYLDTIHALAQRHPDKLTFATTAAGVREAKRAGRVAILVGVEGGHSIESSLANLREMHRRGARYMTLTWNNGTAWAGSAAGADGTRTGGLTDFGREVVREMNRLGMLVDISHVSEATFYDALAASADPVIASHSSARAINDHVRNLTDDQLRAMARNGGVVNVNFYATFIDPNHWAARKAIDARLAEDIRTGVAREEAQKRADAAVAAIPRPSLSVLLDHFDHIKRVAGVDHVGIGSDFDGVGGLLPQGMDEVTKLPLLVQGLLARGWSEQDIRKVLGGNMLRVMDRVLDRK